MADLRRVLVTGASGFIGRHVAERLLREQYEVVGLDVRDPPEALRLGGLWHFSCDLCDASEVNRVVLRSAPDAVIHLAAETDIGEGKRPLAYAANVQGVQNLLRAIADTPSIQRAIFTSTQLVCRIGHRPTSMDEYCPDTAYGESKQRTEELVKAMDGGGTIWSLVRPTTVWGPYMSAHYQRMLQLIRRGLYFHCGRRDLWKSYGYVENIAYQYERLLTAPEDKICRCTFYLADYEPLSLRAYGDALARELGAPAIRTLPLSVANGMARVGDLIGAMGWKRFPLNSFRLRNILTEYVFDLHATKAVCGELPFSWQEGVRATCKWFLGRM